MAHWFYDNGVKRHCAIGRDKS